ncbi:hypothetical protein HYFRA_00001529 [Hymenoscyphus fraxineus]|uniref:Proteophosphoglycan 5 n=1 Tax=Hymenoscyphus fraxineus TaxID=746836 RepID=A0A9N9L6V3_9HELO|nr:hypothetical protein HYFRA_00001529 [Hymenoscyphus fraxineus]
MSVEEVPSRRHRPTRSAAHNTTATTPPSQNPHSPHHLNAHMNKQHSTAEMSYPTQPSTPPRTPRRNQNPNTANSAARETGSKQKSRNNKNRPKNVVTSPPVKSQGRDRDRHTPPLNGAQPAGIPSKPLSTPSAAIYAGATFHASPAPSALPIPSFYSKSVPDSPGLLKGLRSMKDAPIAQPNTQSPSPPTAPPSISKHREESPLDFFFKADREEKERARSTNSANVAGQPVGPFPPPAKSQRNLQTPPASKNPLSRPAFFQSRSSPNGLFAMELDENPGTPFGPAFSTPYAERIKAARSNSEQRPRDDAQASLERSEALKAYLFSGHSSSTPAANGNSPKPKSSSSPNKSLSPPSLTHTKSAPSSHYNFAQEARAQNYNGNAARSSGLRQQVTPSKTPSTTPNRNNYYAHSTNPSQIYGHGTPTNAGNFMANTTSHASSSGSLSFGVSSANRGADLQGMEDSLRKILKLDSSRSSAV